MKRTSTLPYFPIDSGKALAQCAGLPLEEVGALFMLMLYYWENECSLPSKERLIRRLRLKGRRVDILERVLEDFFPNGINEYLDLCRDQAMTISRQNAENARKGHEKRKVKEQDQKENLSAEIDDDDF